MTLVSGARDLLFRPGEFFERGGSRPFPALVVVGVVSVIVFAAGWTVFEMMITRINGTVMVDNPAYPGDAFCQGTGDPFVGKGDPFVGNCDAPEKVERDVDAILEELRGGFLLVFLFGPVLGWLFIGLVLHVGSWLAGDEGTVKDSFAVAAWGTVPSVFSIAIGVAVFWVTFDPITVTPDSTPEEFVDLVTAEFERTRGVNTLVGIVTVLWSAYIHVGGLVATRGVPRSRAVFIAGIVAVLAVIGTL
jgi:hypothetical protein